ncbi:Terpene synthase: metal-binding protein-like protein [Leptotrombidium deliense]|uniref:Terpene synthase n=1 Tax=Leptotrombidium deliense TaxID=299467 RepID=A0A443S4M8_9ACAR|nr:Terpene synthase: metal-binding protein-like protein [Leptotrombidium deliense]
MSVVVNIKAIECPFPLFSNPLQDECEKELNIWLEKVGALSTEKDRKFFSDLCIVPFVSTYLPNASLPQILFAAKMSAVGVYADDYYDGKCGVENMTERVEKIKALERGEKVEAENLFEKLGIELYSEALTMFDEKQKAWLKRKCYDYVRSYQWQNRLKRRKRIPEIGEYMALRGITVTNDIAIDLSEFIGGINLPLIAKCDQSVMNMYFLANQISWLINDLVSLENDVNTDFPANLVMSIKNTRRCTWQEAADEVYQILLDSVEEFKCWEKYVTKFYDENLDKKVNEYIFYLKNTVNANIHFHYGTNRYKFKTEHVLNRE